MRHANTGVSGLKRTFMHVSVLPPPYFDFKKKTITKVVGFLTKTWWVKT